MIINRSGKLQRNGGLNPVITLVNDCYEMEINKMCYWGCNEPSFTTTILEPGKIPDRINL